MVRWWRQQNNTVNCTKDVFLQKHLWKPHTQKGFKKSAEWNPIANETSDSFHTWIWQCPTWQERSRREGFPELAWDKKVRPSGRSIGGRWSGEIANFVRVFFKAQAKTIAETMKDEIGWDFGETFGVHGLSCWSRAGVQRCTTTSQKKGNEKPQPYFSKNYLQNWKHGKNEEKNKHKKTGPFIMDWSALTDTLGKPEMHHTRVVPLRRPKCPVWVRRRWWICPCHSTLSSCCKFSANHVFGWTRCLSSFSPGRIPAKIASQFETSNLVSQCVRTPEESRNSSHRWNCWPIATLVGVFFLHSGSAIGLLPCGQLRQFLQPETLPLHKFDWILSILREFSDSFNTSTTLNKGSHCVWVEISSWCRSKEKEQPQVLEIRSVATETRVLVMVVSNGAKPRLVWSKFVPPFQNHCLWVVNSFSNTAPVLPHDFTFVFFLWWTWIPRLKSKGTRRSLRSLCAFSHHHIPTSTWRATHKWQLQHLRASDCAISHEPLLSFKSISHPISVVRAHWNRAVVSLGLWFCFAPLDGFHCGRESNKVYQSTVIAKKCVNKPQSNVVAPFLVHRTMNSHSGKQQFPCCRWRIVFLREPQHCASECPFKNNGILLLILRLCLIILAN